MPITYANGVRVGELTFDPTGAAIAAFWTHRPARRPPSSRLMASRHLAQSWAGAQGLPMESGAVAMGYRIELLPTGYGAGGSAVLLTKGGERALVVGPTTTHLVPRSVDHLVLYAPDDPAPPEDWLARARETESDLRLVVPDGGSAAVVCDALTAEGIVHRGPRWLPGARRGPAPISVSLTGPGLVVDARPQATHEWLVSFAGLVMASMVYVHGPQANRLAKALDAAGHSIRILHAPRQLSLLEGDTGGFPRVEPVDREPDHP